MASILGLFVIVRVEVNVVQYDNICSRQVDAKTTGLRRQQEYKDGCISVELVNQVLTVNTNNSVFHHSSMYTSECCVVFNLFIWLCITLISAYLLDISPYTLAYGRRVVRDKSLQSDTGLRDRLRPSLV